jgi:branched-chain amino acid transport system permease protein
VSFIGFVSPFDFLPIFTFQIWAMLIVGGSGNNRGALLGALVVWAIWTASGVAVTQLVPPSHAAQGAAVQVILIGLALMLVLLYRPRGLLGEQPMVSRHADP